nr:MAG TPA: hypothetical protein [Caudoviricetes sp.]
MIEYSVRKEPMTKQMTIVLEEEKYKDLILNARLDKCKIISQQWQSVYNSYVAYDYSPICSEGFKYTCTLEFNSEDYMEFFYYDLTSKLDLINHLEGCLQIEYTGGDNK